MADATGWASLGATLGGDSEGEYQKALALGAQTQNALAQARQRVEQAKALADMAPLLKAAGMTPEQAAAAGTGAQGGLTLGDVLGSLRTSQEVGFRGRAGAPLAGAESGSVADRNAALMGVASGPVDTLKAVGSRGYQDILHPEAGVMPLAPNAADLGNQAAPLQVLHAFGFIDPATGQVRKGMERQAFDVMRSTQRVIDAGGVPALTNANPFGSSGAAPPAPAGGAAPGLGDLLAPPSGVAPPAGVMPPRAPAAAPSVTQPVSLAQVTTNAAAIAGAKKKGETMAEKQMALPDTINNLTNYTDAIDKFTKSPGFDMIYGRLAGRATPVTTMFSQDAADADALRTQLNSKSFQASIQSMRGLGQLSNQEGLKVQTALTTLSQPNISPDAARESAKTLRSTLNRLKFAAQAEAYGHVYETEDQAAAANLPAGTPVAIGGVLGTM